MRLFEVMILVVLFSFFCDMMNVIEDVCKKLMKILYKFGKDKVNVCGKIICFIDWKWFILMVYVVLICFFFIVNKLEWIIFDI